MISLKISQREREGEREREREMKLLAEKGVKINYAPEN
jgi:hypothetical protein